MNSDPFYKVILEAMITDTEASLRMLNEIMHPDHNPDLGIDPDLIPIKSSLRRAIADAKAAIKGYENE